MKKKYVFNQNGFLLLEHLIALFITALLSLLLVLLLQVVKNYQINPNQITHQEVETLATRLQKESRRLDYFSINQQRLLFHLNDQSIISYHIQNNRLIRQRDGRGGEIALYHCKNLTIELLNEHSVLLELTSTHGDIFTIYLSKITFPLNKQD